ncbi:MAG: penicillin-binding protein 1C [Xenococcaceae cyanobacterium]
MWLIKITNHIQQQLWQQRSRKSRVILGVVLLLLIVRSLPYLAPIRAADLVQDQQAIEFSDRHGLPLGTILTRDQDHTAVVPLNEVSPHFIHAILAAEDGQFYRHGALEMRAIARSLIQAIQSKRIVSGASTITMQLARMLEPAPRTISAKLKEIWLSWRLAAGMSKDEILQAYINRLPMGGNIYGVEAAARVYFGIPATELNLAQASLLAALPNNPTYLNPYDYWEPLKKRQLYVLNRMVKDKYITPTQAERAHAEEISLQSRQQGIIAAPHFLFWLFQSLEGIQSDCHPDGASSSCSQLSHVRTTIDRPLQQFVEAQVQEVVRTLTPYNVHQAAALVIDNHTGEVLAYVGSVDYFSEAQLGRNDGVQALRQPGSTLKPFLYQLALEKRLIRPNTVLADVPTHYPIPGARLYSPTDYTETFQGPVRIRIALANSLNVPAVRVLEKVGVPTFLERLHQLGFEHLNQPPEYYGLGLTLGSGEVSLWELARAYLILAKQGEVTPIIPTFSQSKISNPMEPGNKAKSKIQNQETWALITDMLSDRHARAKAFGVESVLNLPFPAAVKTGTSSNFRDTWTVGFTTDYTVATWVGNFNGEPMRQVSGVIGAAPLWHRIMLHLHEHKKPASFPSPPGMVERPVCALSGLKPTPACPSVVQEYFYPEDLRDYESQSDTFYQIVSSGREGQSPQYRLNLPEEYDEWLAIQRQSTLVPTTLKILSPGNGDYFLLEPNDSVAQRLEFKLGGVSNQAVEWWLNGEKLATESSNSFFWQLRPGNWTLEVRSGEMTDKVRFQVQLAENRANRRGFSVAGSSENH